jgi:hypothetical protein
LRRTVMSESGEREMSVFNETRDKDIVPDKAPRRVSHPPAASNGAIAAALCLRRPESAYIALDRSC